MRGCVETTLYRLSSNQDLATLKEKLTRVKDRLPISNVVYQIPCSCGKYYIGETTRRLGTRLKEHKDACERCLTDKSAVAEHAWHQHHPITWDGTKIIDQARREDELRLKEAFHIQMSNNDFNTRKMLDLISQNIE